MSVPTNLIPTKITGLPEYTGTSQAGYFPYVLDGTTYKVQFSSVASAGEVPPSRTLTAGTGLVGGGDLSANRVFAIANGGVGAQQLDTTGVVAGVYGNASNIPTVTVDANGRVTSVTTSPVVATGYVPESRTITAGTGLIGGGSLANNITLSLNLSSATPQALGTATAGVSTAAARGDHVHPAVNLSDTNETQGALPLGRGGTGDALSPVAGAVVYSTGTKLAMTNPGAVGQVLVSTGTDEPVWSFVGSGTVTSVNASGGSTGMTFTGGPITTSGTLTLGGTLATGSGGTGLTGTPTNGQLLIGNGTGYALSTLTAGTAVSITNAVGSITIDNTAPDQIVSLTGAGTTTISGTYPNFTITSNDQFTGTVTSVAASGGTTGLTFSGSPITSAGTLTLGGTLAVANGGTGATTASGARTNLGAAASGANSDITSLSGITGGISTPTFITFDTTGGVAPSLGQLRWDSNDGTLDLGLNGGATLKVGQQTLFYAKNTSGGTIPIGTPVMFTGVVGASGKLTFGLAVANGSVPPEYMMGVTTQNVVNNDFGYITSFGLVRGFNTSGAPYGETWADGDLLYFSPATPGGWTKVEPQAPNIHVPVAVVVNAATGGSGSIFVRMIQSERLGELQDVEINGGGPAAGQVLIYDASQSRWENNTLTAGSNVTITNGNGSITIAATEQFTGTVTSVAASGGTTGLTFSGSPITSAGTLTLGGTLAIGSGGTGATTAGGARTALGAAASGANTDITSIALTSGTILNAPTSGTDIVNKAYADSIASGINFHQSVRLATVAPLPANTYNNGSSGVGATLTANANGALSIDGVAVVAGNRVLVKDEVAQANNGVYVVTQTGSGSTPYILTRATDFDSAGTGVDQIDAGDFFLVTAGNTLANTSWVQQTPLPITVGTTPIIFSQFGAPVLYSAGTGLSLAGTVFSIANTGVSASTYGSASQVPVLAVNAQGQITSASNTSISIAASQVTSGSLAVAQGGTGLGTTPTNGQLLIGNGTGYSLSTLSAGTGISVSNGSGSVTVTNTAPDQIVTITGGGATVVTGTYPNFTVSTTTGTGTVTSVNVSGGTTGLSFTGGPITSSGIITMGGTLGVANGGTGVTTSTGTGSVVLSNSPTLVTPTLGAASATSIANGLGSVGAPSYTFTGDTNTGIYSPAADTLAFVEGGVEAMRIDSSANVGIGIAPSGFRLQVEANTNGNDGAFIRNSNTGATAAGSLSIASPVGSIIMRAHSAAHSVWPNSTLIFSDSAFTGGMNLFQNGANPIIAWTNGSERMRITAAGGVAVGTTTDPGAGNIGLAAGGRLQFSSSAYVTPENNVSGAEISTPGAITFRTGSGTPERARIDGDGRLLVGQTSALNNGTIDVLGTSRQAIVARVTNDVNSLFQGFNAAASLAFQVTGGGETFTSSSFRGPIFYDSNDTAYYVDPASTSFLNVVRPGVIQFASTGNTAINLTSSTYNLLYDPNGRIALYLGGAGDPGNYYDNDGHYFRNRAASSIMAQVTGSGVFAPIYYDISNTGFYVDPASGTNLNGPFVTTGGPVMTAGWNRTAMLGATFPVLVFNSANTKYSGIGVDYSTPGAGFYFWVNGSSADVTGTGTLAMSISQTGFVQALGDFRAPIFYDSNNTGFYVDGASHSYLNTLGLLGGLNVLYNNPADRVDGAPWYGIGGMSDNLRVQVAGFYGLRLRSASAIVDLAGDYAQANGSFRAPIFYDSNNTAYFLDPNTTGNALRTAGWWQQDSTAWGGDIGGKIQYHGNNWYFNAANEFIFRASNGSQPFYVTQAGVAVAQADMRAPIFYDLNNTGFYVDPASTSVLNTVNLSRINMANSNSVYADGDGNAGWRFGGTGYVYLNQAGLTYAQTAIVARGGVSNDSAGLLTLLGGTSGGTQINTDTRSPIYYDLNNTGFYLDPASTSNLNRLLLQPRNDNYFVGSMNPTNAVADLQSLTNVYGQFTVTQYNEINNYANAPGGVYTYGAVLSWRTTNHSFQLYAAHTGDLSYKTQWQNDNFSGWLTPVVYGRNGGSSSGKNIFGAIYYDADNTAYYVDAATESVLNTVTIFGEVNLSASGINYIDHSGTILFRNQSGFATSASLTTSGNFTATGNVTAYSDARLKKDVETISGALDLVSKMRGVRYTRIDTENRNVGVIAQEMLEVVPEVVQQGIGDDDTLSVAYGNLVGVLIEAIKELRAEVAELKGK